MGDLLCLRIRFLCHFFRHPFDDFHHAAHVVLTGETDGYYADFALFHQDPFQLTPEQFSQLEADMTVINGQPTL